MLASKQEICNFVNDLPVEVKKLISDEKKNIITLRKRRINLSEKIQKINNAISSTIINYYFQ
jgi:hypothetical protein